MDNMELKSPKKKFRFSNRRHSKPAAVSVCISVVSLIVLVCCISAGVKGMGHIDKGVCIAAVFAFVMQIVSVVIAFRSRMERDIFMVLPNFALGFSCLAVLPWLYVYVTGFSV